MKILAEHESKNLLSKYGINVPKFKIIENEEDLNKLNMRYPVVLKISSPKILHKTDVGGIIFNINNKRRLLNEYKKLKEKFPKEKIMVEEMMNKGIEIIIGVIDDDVFGKCIMVGMGGIFTEAYKDVSFRMLPIKKEDAIEMIRELKAYRILKERLKLNERILQDLLLKIADIAMQINIKQLDLNPVFLYEKSAVVIDAKIIMEE